MFEKEAEEYRESITQRLFNEDDVESAWQKGAEFGYNKTKEELEKQLADLEWQLQEVAKDNDYYQTENKRLEAQIEKMKNCNNCAGYYTEQCLGCEDYCNWKLN